MSWEKKKLQDLKQKIIHQDLRPDKNQNTSKTYLQQQTGLNPETFFLNDMNHLLLLQSGLKQHKFVSGCLIFCDNADF